MKKNHLHSIQYFTEHALSSEEQ